MAKKDSKKKTGKKKRAKNKTVKKAASTSKRTKKKNAAKSARQSKVKRKRAPKKQKGLKGMPTKRATPRKKKERAVVEEETRTCCQDSSEKQWSHVEYVEEGTGGDASVDLGRYDESAILIAKDFGFNIPANTQINGIRVTVTTDAGGADADDIVNQTLQLSKTSDPNNPSGTVNQATDEQLNSGQIQAGAPTDKWGTTWQYYEINSVNFGVLFRAENYSGSTAVGTALVDKVKVEVWYT